MDRRTLASRVPRLLFTLVIILLAVMTMVGSLTLGSRAGLFPGVSSTIVLVMAVLQLLADIWPERGFLRLIASRGVGAKIPSKEEAKGKEKLDSGSGSQATTDYRVFGLLTLSVVAFIVLVAYLSIYVAVTFFVAVCLGLIKKERWLLVAAVAVGGNIFVWLVFVRLLGATF